jgi:hypothetical protein
MVQDDDPPAIPSHPVNPDHSKGYQASPLAARIPNCSDGCATTTRLSTFVSVLHYFLLFFLSLIYPYDISYSLLLTAFCVFI